jgi:hypothetical protein
MTVKFRVVAMVLAAASISGAALAQNRVADLRARLAHEPNPVSRAKLMPALGDAEFAAIDADVTQGKISEALTILQTYRDDVRSCDKALDALGQDAGKHPGGYKQLEFSLRDSLRRLDGVVVNMTSDEQAPFLDIRKELSETNAHLIEHLFPHDPRVKQDEPPAAAGDGAPHF